MVGAVGREEDAVLADAACPAPAGRAFFTCGVALEAPKPAVPRYGIEVVGVVDVDLDPAGAEPERAPFVASGAGASFRGPLFWPTSPGLEALRLRAEASGFGFADWGGRCGGRAPGAGFGEPVPRRGTGGVFLKMVALLGSIEVRMSARGWYGR